MSGIPENKFEGIKSPRVHVCLIQNKRHRLPQMSTDVSKFIKYGQGLLEDDFDNPLALLEISFKALSPSRLHLCLFFQHMNQIATDELRWIMQEVESGNPLASLETSLKALCPSRVHMCSVPFLKPKAKIATDEHRYFKNHVIRSKDARGGL